MTYCICTLLEFVKCIGECSLSPAKHTLIVSSVQATGPLDAHILVIAASKTNTHCFEALVDHVMPLTTISFASSTFPTFGASGLYHLTSGISLSTRRIAFFLWVQRSMGPWLLG